MRSVSLPATADVVVVGTGIIGASIGYHLTEQGARVAFVDRAEGVAAGATRLSGGMVRAYDPDPGVGGLALAGLERYADPGCWPTGCSPLVEVGSVTIGPRAAAPVFRDSARSLNRVFGPSVSVVADAREAMGVGLAGGAALIEKRAGYVSPPEVTTEWIRHACGSTASLHLGAHVSGVRGHRAGASLLTSAGTIEAGAVVTAVGGWGTERISGFPPAHGVRTRSIQVAVVRRPAGAGSHATFVDLRTGVYAKPLNGGRSLIGRPHLVWGVPTDPQSPPDPEHTRSTVEALVDHLPWVAEAEVIQEIRSFDGYTEKSDVVEEHQDERLWSVRAWNGTGVKVAPEVGSTVAESVLSRF